LGLRSSFGWGHPKNINGKISWEFMMGISSIMEHLMGKYHGYVIWAMGTEFE